MRARVCLALSEYLRERMCVSVCVVCVCVRVCVSMCVCVCVDKKNQRITVRTPMLLMGWDGVV